MIEKYYNGAIEQVVEGLGNAANNSVLVRYSNDFSICDLPCVKKYEKSEELFFVGHEFFDNEIPGGYEPYLAGIRSMFGKYMTCSVEEFMEECDVYYLHRPIIQSYFEKGICKREEKVLLDEVEYEQERMTGAIVKMLCRLSEVCPIVILMNRFQMAAKSTMMLTYQLLCSECKNIGIILGVNDVQTIPEFLLPAWENIYEKLDDGSRVYHIGDSGKKIDGGVWTEKHLDYGTEDRLHKLNNLVELLDYEQAFFLMEKVERQIKFDNLVMSDENIYWILSQLANVSILTKDLAKALEICGDLEKLHLEGKEQECGFEHDYLVATAYMYQGKLPEALEYAKRAGDHAGKMQDEYRAFHAELLEAQIQMSGWYNIFFCTQDVKISDSLIERLILYNFKNHLAHIYIYAYDNKPEIVAKAYRSEALLIYFSRGVAIAKEIGNEKLVNTAYQKNIMLASTNGMYEISLLYSVRTSESLKSLKSVEGGRIYSGIAYNLCAMGQNEMAGKYYNYAVALFYELRRPEDIAEVQYNMSLNYIMLGEYAKAEIYLMQCMKAIEKLHLNSLRVCNLSKLYGLLALVSILQGNRFNCERYLYNCSQFLNYVLEKEKMENSLGTVHDYAKVDDDMFLYTFAMALLERRNGNKERTQELFQQAEEYLKRAEGNQFFSYALFRRSRMEWFQETGKDILYEREKEQLLQYEEVHSRMFDGFSEELCASFPPIEQKDGGEEITLSKIDELIGQESILVAYNSKKRQLNFISTWQKLIDVTGVTAETMMESVMKNFLNHFNVDCAVYVRYIEDTPQVLWNNTGIEMHPEVLRKIEYTLKKNTGGFAISKISSNYAEHQEVAAIFGEDDVCSMVAVPFFDNARIESFLIAYVRMKDNWHSSVNRYMLDEDDLNMYQLLFREVRYSLNRLEAYDKIYEMNTRLYLSAVTDQLTGICNREGFYRKLSDLIEEIKNHQRAAELGLMFVDLDNFKYYNDTFGHDVGDLILKKMSEIFDELSRDRGFVCRYGGDEFIIVLYTTDREILENTAKQVYERIQKSGGFEQEISERIRQKVVIDSAHKISCSIGIAASSGIHDEEEINQMIKNADNLLYSVKTSTKGTYKIL